VACSSYPVIKHILVVVVVVAVINNMMVAMTVARTTTTTFGGKHESGQPHSRTKVHRGLDIIDTIMMMVAYAHQPDADGATSERVHGVRL